MIKKTIFQWFGDNPEFGLIMNVGAGLLSLAEWTTPLLKWVVLLISAVIGILTIIEKVKKLKG